MGLETATFISELVPSNPAGTDPKSQGDDHLRLIKQVLQNTFPNANAVQVLPKEQTWQDVTASRVLGDTYTNNTGQPITVSVFAGNGVAANFFLSVNGNGVVGDAQGAGQGGGVIGIVPDGATYRVQYDTPSSPAVVFWQELRN